MLDTTQNNPHIVLPRQDTFEAASITMSFTLLVPHNRPVCISMKMPSWFLFDVQS